MDDSVRGTQKLGPGLQFLGATEGLLVTVAVLLWKNTRAEYLADDSGNDISNERWVGKLRNFLSGLPL
jgi:hypothetical protein